MKKKKLLAIWLMPIILLMMPGLAFAATSGVVTLSGEITNTVTSWYSHIKTVAEEIFYTLFVIDLAWLFAQWLISGKDFHEVFSSFIKKLVVIGFFYTVLLNGHTLVGAVINGFRETGIEAAGQPHTGLSWILNTGFKIFVACIEGPIKSGSHGAITYIWDTITSGGKTVISTIVGELAGLFAGLIAILALIYTALEYVGVQIEAVFVASVGIIMMGFSGSRWTSEFAIGYLKYALTVGIRFMVLVIWIAFIEQDSVTIINNLLSGVKHSGGTNIGTTVQAYAGVIAFSLLVAWLTKKLPSLASSIVTGGSSASAGSDFTGAVASAAVLGAAAVTGGAALAAGGAAEGAAMTGAEAASMATGAGEAGAGAASMAAGAGEAGASGLSGAGVGFSSPPPPPPSPSSPGVSGPTPPAPPQSPESSGSPKKPLGALDIMRGVEAGHWVHQMGEGLLSPGDADTSGVQAPSGGNLSHGDA